MLRFLILGFAVLWAVAAVGRLSRRLGRGPARRLWAPRPEPEPPSTREQVVGLARLVIATVLIGGLAAALFARTDLPDIVVVLITAPVAGLVWSLLSGLWTTTDEAPDDETADG